MPHTTLEYTPTIAEQPDFQAFWEQLHRFLSEDCPFHLKDIKSRAYRCDEFRMAGGARDLAFVHLTILVLEGRDEATLTKVGQGALDLLKAHFARSLETLQADLTVEVRGMRKDCYFKATSVKAP
ncbi:5-carboxymethyl-2-hydroxymuconate Delta-isomerase [Mesoterricola silvestris]|uniref:5-carboxymethyl-2-hydroxymuconate isomerase n=1 Tax=Mesoterricola silvestris TaxID=2927979 RepID=A0AA48GHY8_9BACT|nr:5-carboxymethyl-2-hydroxymuconate Delta-isomerase [Mesoterricola silvestris]BDU73241.1 5-carboxymethyl-2-hydroxymuconate isomerase [Mesoterricola silvestris]